MHGERETDDVERARRARVAMKIGMYGEMEKETVEGRETERRGKRKRAVAVRQGQWQCGIDAGSHQLSIENPSRTHRKRIGQPLFLSSGVSPEF